MAPDGRMFQTSRKGELFELKQGLNATTAKERKNSLKRTVAAMTLGKDVSSLFTDVVKNTAGDLSMKKLVYLYIINYASAKPDLAILIINTFIKDAADPNPLIRALSIRTMALVPLEKITEHLCTVLHSALKDQDPYVRKTAAVCVAKLYQTNAELAVEEGFLKDLQELLGDGNPMVVSNAVAALSEISQSSKAPGLLSLTPQTVPRFLGAMAECTEWGQVFILDAISAYTPGNAEEADLMVERIVPRLQHANPAVVLSSIRNIVNFMPKLDADSKRTFLVKKMSAPLVTLLTAQPEIQFVALRNIALLVREFPSLLSGDVRVFYASYADPMYVKTEKLNMLVKLTDPGNIDAVLTELMEYTDEVEVLFAQKAVDSIGKIALRMPVFASKCVGLLSNLLRKRVVHITEQTAVALKDILRAYPDQFDDIIVQLCGSADDMDDPTSKSSLIWIIGEHANKIPTAIKMLEVASESIDEETVSVQLQILTACVKSYLLRGYEAQKLVDAVLNYATQESEHVDVRDRGFIYQRLIAGGMDAAQQVVLSNRQGIDDRKSELPAELEKDLLKCLSSVAAVYHKPAKIFEGARKKAPIGQPILGRGDLMAEEDLLGIVEEEQEHASSGVPPAIMDSFAAAAKPMGDSLLEDILGGSGGALALPAPPPSAPQGEDLLSSLGMGEIFEPVQSQSLREISIGNKELLSANRGNGLSIRGGLSQGKAGSFVLTLELFNSSDMPMSDFAVQLNKNTFGLVLSGPLVVSTPLLPGSTAHSKVPLQAGGAVDTSKGLSVQVAMKFTPGGVVYFADDVTDHIAAVFDRKENLISKPRYLSIWQGVPDTAEVRASVHFGKEAAGSPDYISQTLATNGIFTVAKRMNLKAPVIYLSAVIVGGGNKVILGELTLPASGQFGTGSIASRSALEGNVELLKSFNESCSRLLAR